MTPIFQHGTFTLHSGKSSNFLINALALSERDLAALAAFVAPSLRPFSTVYGIPRGGVNFANALKPYATPGRGGRLVVDDVTTTGASFHEMWEDGDRGVVIFNRSGAELPDVLSIFMLSPDLVF